MAGVLQLMLKEQVSISALQCLSILAMALQINNGHTTRHPIPSNQGLVIVWMSEAHTIVAALSFVGILFVIGLCPSLHA